MDAMGLAKSILGLEFMVEDFKNRADYFRQHAVDSSLMEATVFFERKNASRIVDIIDKPYLTRLDDDKIFLLDEDGICFARVEGEIYYPIDVEGPKRDLEKAEKYGRMARSVFARYIHGNVIFYGIDKRLFDLQKGVDSLRYPLANICFRFRVLNDTFRSYCHAQHFTDSSIDSLALLPDRHE